MKEKRYMGRELRVLDNLIKRFIDNQMNGVQIDRITGSNGWIIAYLRDHPSGPVYQKDLESEFNITRSTASKVVNLMEEKGLIRRESVPEDARLKKLTLMPKAIALGEEMERNRDIVEAQIVKGFTEDELEQFYSYIERIKKNVSEG
ncbi:MarR family transcriptional regulator [Faecalicatena sp. AGMB00832]|uniref:MarR family transcriptional regulator n=1 Tax=Faecalicatena faecalis TaxID=2726362 RepID=A0ABS6CZ96_9FIRM|nr:MULTISPECIES: MarR family transcriptional regulator [Faecalicatena]MBU3874589.1 MarR family transcriptional regulator [Faecalicatena faecalis]MCI6464786.1 MarR family transcriptional regulator [Faecalicatena sp.]